MAWYTYPCEFLTSDGRLEFIGKTGKTELNQPTKIQQDQTPDADGAVSYYRKVADDAQKSVEWKIKLGTSLMKMLGGKAHSGNPPPLSSVNSNLHMQIESTN